VLWARVQLQFRDGAHAPVAVASPTQALATATSPTDGASLADANQRVIDATLQAHGGNVSRAARALGVSRGLLYRRLKARSAVDASAEAAD